MKTSRFFDEENGIVHTTVTGELTVHEILADMAKITAHPAYRPGMPGIIDLRGVTKFLSEVETEQLAQTIKIRPGVARPERRALLVGSDFSYGMYRMFEYFAHGGKMEYSVFRDEDEALAWVIESSIAIVRE